MEKIVFRYIVLIVLCLVGSHCTAVEVQSPNGLISLSFNVENARAVYQVSYRGKRLVEKSRLGFQLTDGTYLGSQLKIIASEKNSHDSTWKPVYGEKNAYRDHYNELTVNLRSSGGYVGDLSLIFRCYDAGVAFRYTITNSSSHEEINIKAETTEFAFADDHDAWCTTKAQGKYEKRPLSKLGEDVERPLTIQAGRQVYVSIAEASLQGYARMKLRSSSENFRSIVSQLSSSVKSSLPLQTPWRVIMIADSPGQLLENNGIILNLNKPCAIADTSWIKPGKVLREMTLTTAGGKAAIDFAVKHNFGYVEFDAGWYGNEYDEKSDATTVTLDPKRSKGPFDLHECIQYGKERGIGVIVYVNRRCLEHQLDEILPLYEKWGLKGVKYGFVNVGTQKWNTWLQDAIRKAADHHLMLDIHDAYRSMGFARTYPNLMTQEGVGGDEESPDGEQALANMFTRYLAGAADFTPCYFNDRVGKITTHAHQLAKPVCLYSPWQFLFWYDSPLKSNRIRNGKDYIHETPELEFWDAMPTVWDDTKVLNGSIGEHATVARRSGDSWFVGTINGAKKRILKISCDFLSPDINYVAHIYSDDQSVDSITEVRIDRFLIDHKTIFEVQLLANGGQAMRIVPATEQDKYPRFKPKSK